MRSRLSIKGVVLSLVGALLASLLVAAGALAEEVYVDVVINGRRLYQAGLVYGDRTYVRLADVAQVLDGELIYDPDLKVAFVNTGRYRSLNWRNLIQLNPKLQGYQPMSPFEAGEGVHWGVPGPHLTVVTTPAGVVTGFKLTVAESQTEHRPWFDQENPIELPSGQKGYSQLIYVVHPDLIRLGGATVVAFNGLPLRVAPSAILWYEDELYVRLRDLAVATGGGVGWDAGMRVASAKVVAGAELTFDKLVFLNPAIRTYYTRQSPHLPGLGYRYGALGPSVSVGMSDNGENLMPYDLVVNAFEVVLPDGQVAWMPWFDQEEGVVEDIGGVPSYTQRIYLVPAESIE
ncbi:MAG TPA: hypothetical protein VK101_03850 [Limnochordia bacterium]|mgnify:CR=1 FL=1|nr:hypothetical protein [Limnochordia bacterium]